MATPFPTCYLNGAYLPLADARISPLDASAATLAHVRAAWDLAHPDAPLAQQAVVLTVPAFQVFWSDHDVINHHKRRYRRHRIREMIGEEFDFEVLSYYNTHLFPIAVAVRMLKKIEMALYPAATRKVEAENTYLPRSLNSLFASIFGAERLWLRRFSSPIGLSIICVARRKTDFADSRSRDEREPSAGAVHGTDEGT